MPFMIVHANSPNPIKRITAILAGAWIAFPDLGLVRAFDVGIFRSPVLFYASAAGMAVLLGALVSRAGAAARVAYLVLGALAGTALLYKVGIQAGRWSELANSLNWALVLVLNAIGVSAGALAVRAPRAQAAA